MSHLNNSQIQALVQELLTAEIHARSIAPLHERYGELSISEAYLVQDALTELKLAMGIKLIGYKMGLTNLAKMAVAGVDEPLKGQLFEKMVLKNGAHLSLQNLIQPRVEPEIAFVLKHELGGAEIIPEEVIAATEYVTTALEIVDSRYHGFNFSFSDGIADNICAARVVLGDKKFRPEDLDLANIEVQLFVNQCQQASGVSSVVLDNPINSISALAKLLHQRGMKIAAGSVIITGAITDALNIKSGDEISADFSQLGTIGFKVA